ncbi:hypothetical protein DCAR_0521248 [Daucus carota subsp. sativus]|uniref:O-methyltransferase domain-containing protein n=1 Tax=Daucus carota subsp. sativus TaxID=79200 RepID=A0A161XU90_DAUCS|nr:hypothetical protein DCAR_0521248 [Daucus carota subsp. sativus]
MHKAGLDGYLHPDEIASNLPTKNPEASGMLDRMLRLLTSHSIIKCKLVKKYTSNALLTRAYGLTSISQYLVQARDGPCLVPYHKFNNHKELHNCWYKLKDAILEGGVTFQKAHEGITFFDYLEKDTHLAELLSHAMDGSIATSMAILLQTYRGFEGVKEVVNVGGAHGATLSCIVAMNPHLKGINFDLPHIIKNAPAMPDCQRVLHDWTDEESVKILKKCHEALPDHGKVVIMEMIPTELPENDAIAKNTSQVDIHMMIFTRGGRERTAKEFHMMGRKAGFASSELICRADLYGVIELYKKM